ncbi:hypothetical protein HELRODRAFT_179347 [Helobdella robusta]|uniref:C-type lectin domain-containing protein n=1 Tax=Helobdella robusta TaxID=6412 RepID=T1FEK9_HELRO|nr:hypothetical protein HELRODRAFT_179347 [Helobdella robusta]ESN95571.1 hypothetical protein HELRODRAFT_179347 [Helobdella robusta]
MHLLLFSVIFIVCVFSEETIFPRNFTYNDDSTNTAYACVSGMYLNFTATSKTDCCLICLTNGQMNCLAGNFYPLDGRCEIFEVWADYYATNSGCMSFRKTGLCPPGFTYQPSVKTCLMYLKPDMVWEDGLAACTRAGNNIFMVKVDSAEKGTNVTEYLANIGVFDTCSNSIDDNIAWTGGSRKNRQFTQGDFYWYGPNNSMTIFAKAPLNLEFILGSCVALSIRSAKCSFWNSFFKIVISNCKYEAKLKLFCFDCIIIFDCKAHTYYNNRYYLYQIRVYSDV